MSEYTVDKMFELWRSGKFDGWERGQVYSADMEGWKVEEEGDFTQDCKYQHATNIIKHIESDRYFEVDCSRSGSYHTEWYYSYDSEPVEVVKTTKTITVTEWVAK